MAGSPLFISRFDNQTTSFVNAGATVQPVWTAGRFGSRIHLVNVVGNGVGSNPIDLFIGKVITDNARAFPLGSSGPREKTGGKTPVLSIATTTTVTRTNGSFLIDGWQVGNRIAIINEWNNVQNYTIQLLTTVVAATLTLTSAVNATDTTPPGDMQLLRCAQICSGTLTSGTGTSNTASLNLLTATLMPGLLGQPETYLVLGPHEVLLLKVAAAPGSGQSIEVLVGGGDYGE